MMTLPSIPGTCLRLISAVMLGLVCVAAQDKAPVKPAAPTPTKEQAAPKPAPSPAVVQVMPAPVAPREEAIREAEDEEILAEKRDAEDTVKAARPVTSDLVQVYGWREKVKVGEMPDLMVAKLDTGATTSSLHAENQQIFEREGKKWVKFVVSDPGHPEAKRYDMEAPLVRTVLIKEPGGESERRNVVRLTFSIGERSIKAEFTLNNRNNMVCPVLIGRSTIQVLGWVDPSRTYLADDKILR